MKTPDQLDDDFFNAARRALRDVASRRRQFTTDDIWALIPARVAAGIEPRAMGTFMRRAAAEALCAVTPRMVTSKRPQCHGRPVRVWISMIYSDRPELRVAS